MCVYVCVGGVEGVGRACITCMSAKVREQFVVRILSSHHVGLWARIQVIRTGSNCLFPLSCEPGPVYVMFKNSVLHCICC